MNLQTSTMMNMKMNKTMTKIKITMSSPRKVRMMNKRVQMISRKKGRARRRNCRKKNK